jgi:hypothetical protein
MTTSRDAGVTPPFGVEIEEEEAFGVTATAPDRSCAATALLVLPSSVPDIAVAGGKADDPAGGKADDPATTGDNAPPGGRGDASKEYAVAAAGPAVAAAGVAVLLVLVRNLVSVCGEKPEKRYRSDDADVGIGTNRSSRYKHRKARPANAKAEWPDGKDVKASDTIVFEAVKP